MDSGDKSCNKAMASAHKYAIIQIFAIPTAEMIDSETENYEVKSKNDQPKQQTIDYAAQQKEMLDRFKTLKAENKIPKEEIVAVDALIKYLEGVSPEMDKARWKRARDRFLALKPESEQKEIF
jgi:cbb3-type cytochrome oxidase cytochrome c subunit